MWLADFSLRTHTTSKKRRQRPKCIVLTKTLVHFMYYMYSLTALWLIPWKLVFRVFSLNVKGILKLYYSWKAVSQIFLPWRINSDLLGRTLKLHTRKCNLTLKKLPREVNTEVLCRQLKPSGTWPEQLVHERYKSSFFAVPSSSSQYDCLAGKRLY